MKATELRIGNLVTDTTSIDKTVKIRALDILNIEYWELRDKSKVWYKPIPLTEEWLLKLGFTKVHDTMVLGDFVLESNIRIVKTNELRGFSWEQMTEEKYISIYTVHQLQNLYFALTNEELEL